MSASAVSPSREYLTNRAEFTIPTGNPVFSHELHLSVKLLLQPFFLLFCPDILLPRGEAIARIVMKGIHGVGKNILKSGKVHGVRVSVEKENVIRVH
jgi:hypothetical protein